MVPAASAVNMTGTSSTTPNLAATTSLLCWSKVAPMYSPVSRSETKTRFSSTPTPLSVPSISASVQNDA